MTEVEAAVVRRRLFAMRRLLDHLGTIGPISEQDLNDDLGLRLEVSMAVAQLVTLACEINAHVVRHETGIAPADLRSGFTAMADLGRITAHTAAALRDSPGMRNVLVHEYVDVDLGRVADAATHSVRSFEDYVREVAQSLPEF